MHSKETLIGITKDGTARVAVVGFHLMGEADLAQQDYFRTVSFFIMIAMEFVKA